MRVVSACFTTGRIAERSRVDLRTNEGKRKKAALAARFYFLACGAFDDSRRQRRIAISGLTKTPSAREEGVLEDSLRDRVDHAVGELERSLDEAIASPTTGNLNRLRDAVDRVMRAGARVLIELGRRDEDD